MQGIRGIRLAQLQRTQGIRGIRPAQLQRMQGIRGIAANARLRGVRLVSVNFGGVSRLLEDISVKIRSIILLTYTGTTASSLCMHILASWYICFV